MFIHFSFLLFETGGAGLHGKKPSIVKVVQGQGQGIGCLARLGLSRMGLWFGI